ncbi:Scr1 family TA system antitoxin-like transcriptional regulator [Streptomyces turgidiscabies]|uniref:Toxin-antitoxin system, antitoxin component, Xre domain protein n=1 Tax=Streptomyces turgidiscabies (strain Car8) TaxID=698760 RepID=L7FIT8_STRT8|nr:toxin-antitoxin system, antitoxin component, Xre domain protein [Streptomyces turgidiscabies Car8]GAQ74794.1 hypothetical protein T45_06574 [Streptomyces turgidiscabies]
MEHEREAISPSWYDNAVLPVLLQTAAYAYAVMSERVPAYDGEEHTATHQTWAAFTAYAAH